MLDRRLWLIVAMALQGFTLPCRAEPVAPGPAPVSKGRHEHQQVRNSRDNRSVIDILTERIEAATAKGKFHEIRNFLQNKELLRRLTQGKLSPEQLRFLEANSDKIEKLMKDPRFMKLFNESTDARNKGVSLSERQIENLRLLADHQMDTSVLPPEDGNGGNALEGATGKPPAPDSTVVEDERQDAQAAADGEPERQETWVERELGRLTATFLDDLNDPANTNALANALRSMGALKPDIEGKDHFDLAELWKHSTEDAAKWIDPRSNWPDRISESTSRLYRGLRGAIPAVGGVMSGALEGPPGEVSASSSSTNLISIGSGLLGLILLLIVGRKYGLRFGGVLRGSARGGPAPWPVKPEGVASRDDLVRAFEHLALLRLGPKARTSNHLEIAARLRDDEPIEIRRHAAGELARLYERARYEPDPAPLAEDDIRSARRDLLLLAEGAGA